MSRVQIAKHCDAHTGTNLYYTFASQLRLSRLGFAVEISETIRTHDYQSLN